MELPLVQTLKAYAGGRRPAACLNAAGRNYQTGIEYVPTPGRLFRLMMTNLPKDLSEFTFVDFGSGQGRIVCLASLYNFRHVVGVEFGEALHREATLNIHAMLATGMVRCGSITSVTMGVMDFLTPATPCVFCLRSPFADPVISNILENIRFSYANRPRKMYVIYYNPVHQDLFDCADFLQPVRLRPLCRLAHQFASSHDLRIYETRPL